MAGFFMAADDELLSAAQRVINEYHAHLTRARFGFAYLSEAPRRRGRKISAEVSVVSSRVRFHLNLDYLIWVAFDVWGKMSEGQRFALLDHEFCHCCQNDNLEWATCEHDVQEFVAVIQRHGLWTTDLVLLGEVVQGRLPGIDEVEPAGAVVAAPVFAFEGVSDGQDVV